MQKKILGGNLSRYSVRAAVQQVVPIENGQAEIEYVGVSPAVTRIDFTYCLWGEKAKEKIEKLRGLFKISDSKGNSADNLFDLIGGTEMKESYCDQKGNWCRDFSMQVRGLDKDTESLTFTPYLLDADKEGKAVPGTEQVQEYGEFTFLF